VHISDFNYELPEELIAQEPLPRRDASRMLVVDRARRVWTDSQFSSFPEHLSAGDVVVINNTRVFPARLFGSREPTGGRVEILLLREVEPLVWEALVRPGGRLRAGETVGFAGSELRARLLDPPGGEIRRLRFSSAAQLEEAWETTGEMPLPPYIKRPTGALSSDRERYQTIFASEQGAIAAPTAGLHFTREIFRALAARDVNVVEITLHVGYGTFEPIRSETVEGHSVRPESFSITAAAAATINRCKASGGRVVAIGTTTTRALESAVGPTGLVTPVEAQAELTIAPGHRFRIIDVLLTNFHLPQSSLLLLVSAFAGNELILKAYRHAVECRYRFYSYGDCMLVL
jgi:S-adenosylmethionine:tRNA ribosyltransferase-isomerase